MRVSSICTFFTSASVALAAAFFAGSFGAAAAAAAATFDFADPKGVNSAAFVLDSPLEPIMGVAQGITGSVEFDPEDPAATTGSFRFAASEIETANDRMTSVLHSEKYLDVATYPDVTFELVRVRDVYPVGDNAWRGTIDGSLTLHGITRELQTMVDVTWLPDAAGKRMSNAEGDLLVLRSMFAIDRQAFGIGPKAPFDKVARSIEVRLAIVGTQK